MEQTSNKGSIGKHDWAVDDKGEEGFAVFVDDRQLSYRSDAQNARKYALGIIERLVADGDYRLNDKPAGFLPPPLPGCDPERKMTQNQDANEFLLDQYSMYKKDVAECDPMEFDDWLAGSDIPEIVKAREFAKAKERKLSDIASLSTVPVSKLNLLSANIPGVKSIAEDDGKMVVEFTDGVKATVVEGFVAKLRSEPSYDVFLPSSHGPMFAADVTPSLTADSVMKLLSELASKAVAKSSS